MNLDEELRGALRAHAEDAPDGAQTLEHVRPRVRRLDRRRRFAFTSTAAAVAVAVAFTTPYLLASARRAPRVSTPSSPDAGPTTVSPSPTLSNGSVPALQTTVTLVAATFEPVSFPLTPDFVPAGLGQPTAGRNEV